jgi:ER-bound oxygenase mpaB/B'/Rubber oxygenase, catalytic domain
MGFSYLLIDGLRRLDLELAPQQAEDLYYVWRRFALLMGIHPDGRPDDDSYIPETLAEAAEFYQSYVRRNNTPADRNRYGVVLARDNLKMMEGLLPRPLRLLGFGYAPRICMTELLTPEELARVGLRPMVGHRLIKHSSARC